jgi:3-methylcrotonyl-CoA carboxylase alpha subunit
MEMNTRLQVEHPVTEMITGFDLVEWQLRVAAGEPLPVNQASLAIDGHSIEARIYAENPEKGFLPSIGLLKHFEMPEAVQFQVAAQATGKARVRIDAGVRRGDEITPHYDPMIAKLIVWGETRDIARRTLAQALARLQIVGPATNVDFLRRLMANPAFADADLDTGLIERERGALLPLPEPATAADLALAAAAVLAGAHDGEDPWSVHNGWRIGAPLQRRLVFVDSSGPREVLLSYRDGGCVVTSGSAKGAGDAAEGADAGDATEVFLPAGGAAVAASGGRRINVQVGGQQHPATAFFEAETLHLFTASRHLRIDAIDRIAHAGEAAEEGGRLTAPMPGRIISVLVGPGATVRKGDPLLVMEAMKMEHTISAPADGTVSEIHFGVGDQVIEGAALVAIEQPSTGQQPIERQEEAPAA